MFYVIADAQRLGLDLRPAHGRKLARVGEMIRAAAAEQLPVVHPENPEIRGISISQLWGPATRHDSAGRNAVVVSTGVLDWNDPDTWTGAVDRSPCGTGTCARMAVLYERGELGLNEDFRYESVHGTVFTGKLEREASVGPYRAVVPSLTGTAWITGINQYVVDPSDPFPEGFRVGDIWGKIDDSVPGT
jgi:proline racemase